MSPAFWSNTIWYLLLGMITILELVIIFTKATDRKQALALYITICGLTFYAFEMGTLMCLKAYIYFPKVFADQHNDSVVGNLFSQTSVSASAVLIAVLHLRFYWYLVFAAVYGLIEEWFIQLGIYKHYWYRTWMTVIGLLVLFWVTKTIRSIFLKHLGRAWRYLFVFFGLCALHLNAINWASQAVGVRRYNEALLPDPDCSIVIIAGVYHLFLSIIMMILYFADVKWWWKAAGIAILYIAHYFAEEYQLFTSKDGWFFMMTSISIWGMYLNIYLLDRLYPKPSQPASNRR